MLLLISALLTSITEFSSCDEYFLKYEKEYGIIDQIHRCHILTNNRINYTKSWHGDTKFSDWTSSEFKQYSKGLKPTTKPKNYNTVGYSVDVPESFDWRDKGAVSSVKDQGQCGSCWAESTVGALEGAAFLNGSPLVNMSVQELVDCSHDGNDGCEGGLMDNAFKWVETNGGLCLDEDYPYTARDGDCSMKCKNRFPISSYVDLVEGDEASLLPALVSVGPLAIAVDANSFQTYSGGILPGKDCGSQLDHGVLLIGYGIDNGVKYWTIKNSWGADWGENGFIRIERGVDACGISQQVSYPVASVYA